MNKSLFWLAAINVLASSNCFAQTDIINKAVDRINHCDNMSYSQIQRQKNPFSGEWGSYNNKSTVGHDKSGTEVYSIVDWANYQYIFNGSAQIVLNLKEKTYGLKGKPAYDIEPCPTPYYWMHQLQQMIAKPYKSLSLLPDTLIGNQNRYHIKIIVNDTVAKRDIEDYCFDKVTYLPVFIRQYLGGKMGEGNANDVQAVMINEDTYNDYRVNEKNFTDISAFVIPVDFNAEHKLQPLSVGNKAPDWQLKDTQGKTWSSDELKGKVALIDFSFNECAACMVAIPVMKRLHDKYNAGDVKIFSINTSNTRESVVNFMKKHSLNYPVLLDGSQLSKTYQASGYPAFYVVDKQGNIAASFIGYDDDLEKNLTTAIEKLK